MITKAQFDAAMSDLEKRIEKKAGIKIDAKIVALEEIMKTRMGEMDGRRELAEDEIFAAMEKTLAEIKKDCQANAEESRELKERLCELERFIADTAKEEKDFPMDEEEIRDDFSR